MRLYRPVTVLVGVVLVLLSGVARLTEPKQVYEETNRYTTHGAMNQPVDGKDFTLTVLRAQAYHSYDPRPDDDDAKADPADRPRKTDGIFVAVEFEVEGRKKKGSAGEATLRSDSGTVYTPVNQLIGSSLDIPAPGFVEQSALVFEVNPDDLAGLTFWVRPQAVITVTTEDYAVDLGLPDQASADEFVKRAQKMYYAEDEAVRAK
ncbi:MAG TPA: hypothetical protein VGJ44_27295 [Kribbellaceae bacterium]